MSGRGPPHGGEDGPILESALPPEDARDLKRSRALFALTFLSVFWVYGTQWMGGGLTEPFTNGEIAWQSGKFALGLMAILLAHEMGHYLVARLHGFALSLPYFLPFPAAFGTFGAIIRLRSLPRSRTGLLEMGAAGPLAGFVVAILVLALGLGATVETGSAPEMIVTWPPEGSPPELPDEPGFWGSLMGMPGPGEVPLLIMANPLVMDLMGWLINGHAPGRYAVLDPLAMAGWVGCFLTALNLIPVGQLDGGHVFNALWPEKSVRVSKLGLGLVLLGGILWSGWFFWGVLLLLLGAWRSLPVPVSPPLSPRSLRISALTLLTFVLTFMPTPVEIERISVEDLVLRTEDGTAVDGEAYRAWLFGETPPVESGFEPSEPRR